MTATKDDVDLFCIRRTLLDAKETIEKLTEMLASDLDADARRQAEEHLASIIAHREMVLGAMPKFVGLA